MSVDNDLEAFFSSDIETVVADPDKFRMKLGIGSEAFKYLSLGQNLGSFLTAITGGSAAAGIAFAGWFGSLGTLGTLGLGVGILSTPVGWLAAAGAGGASLFYVTRKLFFKAKDAAVTEVPKFINTPLDMLAVSICDLVCPILLKVAYADSRFCEIEKQKIREYFIRQWGIHSDYVDALIAYDDAKLKLFDWSKLDATLREIEKSGDTKYSVMAKELVTVAEEVMIVDGEIHRKEMEEIEKLKAALRSVSTNKSKSWRDKLSFRGVQPCFIATTTFQDADHPTVATLRKYREQVLRRSPPGKLFISIYWIIGPIASFLVKLIPGLRKLLIPTLNWLSHRASISMSASERSAYCDSDTGMITHDCPPTSIEVNTMTKLTLRSREERRD